VDNPPAQFPAPQTMIRPHRDHRAGARPVEAAEPD